MPNAADIHKLVTDLHQAKVLNGESTVNHVLQTVSASGGFHSQAEKAGWYAIGGDHYVIVCGKPTDQAINVAMPQR